MAFERLGAGPLGYALCHYGDSRIGFRGPKRSHEEPYVAFIGGTMTFGRNVVHPFADRCELALDMEVVNLGCHAAGPDVFLAEPAFLQIANRAEVTVFQIPGAINLTNKYYQVHALRNDRFLQPTAELRALFPELDYTEFAFTRHLLGRLQQRSPKRFSMVRDAIRARWMEQVGAFLAEMTGPCVVLWAHSLPHGDGIDGETPLVSEAMVEAVSEGQAALVDVAVDLDRSEPLEEAAVPAGLPGSEAHQAVAEALLSLLPDLGWPVP